MPELHIYQREMFLAHYHCRSNIETTFSMIKRKFGNSLRSKSETGQYNETLCKVIAHNICVLIACMCEMGLPMPEFSAA
jgi:transposase